MSNYREHGEPLDEVELLIRSAGGFVQVSEELRPRVLEAARLQRGERRVRRQIEQFAVLALALALVAMPLRSSSGLLPRTEPGPLSAVGLRAPFWDAEFVYRSSDANWNLVEVFTEQRRRQAEVFRPNFERPPHGT